MIAVLTLFFVSVLLDGLSFIGSFPISVLAFSINYSVFLFWSYFIRNTDKNLKIKNVPLLCLKPYFEFYWIIISFFFIILSIAACFFFKPFTSGSLTGIPLVFLIITIISYKLLEKSILTAFISEGIRNNVDIKNTSLDSIYVDAREILTKKLIDTGRKGR